MIVIDPFTGEKKYRRMHLLKSISGPGELPDGDPKNDLPEIAPTSTGQVTPNLAPLAPPPEWKSWAKGQKLQWVNQTMEADLAQLRGGQPMTFDLGSIDPEFNLKIANRYRDRSTPTPIPECGSTTWFTAPRASRFGRVQHQWGHRCGLRRDGASRRNRTQGVAVRHSAEQGVVQRTVALGAHRHHDEPCDGGEGKAATFDR